MGQAVIHVQKYTCDNCHYFFYLDDTDDMTYCPYCSCEIVPMEIEKFDSTPVVEPDSRESRLHQGF